MTVQTKLRVKNGVLAAKIQSTPGTFSAPSTSTDCVLCEQVDIGVSPNMVDTNEYNASLDPNSPLVGGQTYALNFSLYIKGSGTPGTAPEFGKLLRMCSLLETVTATDVTATTIGANSGASKLTTVADYSAWATQGTPIFISGFANSNNNGAFLVASSTSSQIVLTKEDGSAPGLTTESAGASVTIRRGISGMAATAGSTTTFTAQSPWAATSELYRFMPVLLSGNPATPQYVFLNDYTVGRVATISHLLSALDTSTYAGIAPNVMYTPYSGTIPYGSIDLYADGVRWRFQDCLGKPSWSIQAGGVIKASIALQGKFYSTDDAAVPTATYDATRPGIWRGSEFLLDRVAVGLSQLSLDYGAGLVFPPNPNDTEGFDPPLHSGRKLMLSMDPFMTLRATRDSIAHFRAGTSKPVFGTVKGALGSTAGNRVATVIPSAKYVDYKPGSNSGLFTDQIKAFAEGADSGAGLILW